MKKINKILALGLAGASLATGGFMLSGCDIDRDNNNTQTEQNQDEQKVVSSISLNTDTLPNYIIKGHFARTNITMTVTYEDNSTKVIDVTESMFSETDKEKLKNVGQYNLTINYGGKTATMYANVVDERYLLKEVVEANLDKDVTLSIGNNTCQIDVDNKIMKMTDVDDGWVGYTWLSNNITYDYEGYDEGCNKSLASSWEEGSKYYHTFGILRILENGKDSEGDPWTIESVEKDGINYVLTAKNVYEDYERTYKWVFNDDFLLKLECEDNDPESWEYNFNYAPITLEVPEDIKALESSATIDSEILDNLRVTMGNYLDSDLEVSVFDNTTNTTEVFKRYDADNNILYYDNGDFNKWYWISGSYWYSKESDSDSAHKTLNTGTWESMLISSIFGDCDLSECTINISSDGQYYELIVTEEDYPDTYEYKYIFNAEEINKIEVRYNDEYIGYYTINRTNVVLEVPAEIKALESSAH